MISSLLYIVGLRPRVYYTLTNFRGVGARPPLPLPQYANDTRRPAQCTSAPDRCLLSRPIMNDHNVLITAVTQDA